MNLKPSQLEMLKLLAQGMTARAIAERLDIAKRTVEHWKTIMARQLGITPRELMLRARENKGSL